MSTLIQTAKGLKPVDTNKIMDSLIFASQGLTRVDIFKVYQATVASLHNGITTDEINTLTTKSASVYISEHYEYSYLASRLMLQKLYKEVFGESMYEYADFYSTRYVAHFEQYLETGFGFGLLNPRLKEFDLEIIKNAIKPERDLLFKEAGMARVYKQYCLKTNVDPQKVFELPQFWLMRVAMGLAINETDKEQKAIEFYEMLSTQQLLSSTPTLLNSGRVRNQNSSCFLLTVQDDLENIYKTYSDIALLSKYAGGIGVDFTNIRATGSMIRGTNGKSLGLIPFIKVLDSSAAAVNQCFDPATMIFTNTGIKSIIQITPKDKVLGISGEYRQVLEKMVYDNDDKPMIKITVKSSLESIKVTDQHPFFAITDIPMGQSIERTFAQINNGKQPDWVPCGQLKVGDYVAQVIPTLVQTATNIGQDEARLYGILLGDGSFDGDEWVIVGHPNKKSMSFVTQYLTQKNINFNSSLRNDNCQVTRFSAGTGATQNATTGQFEKRQNLSIPFTIDDIYTTIQDKKIKQISPRLMHLPKDQVLAMIQGLIWTDGTITVQSETREHAEVSFSNASKELAMGLMYQLNRLEICGTGTHRTRQFDHTGTRADGTKAVFDGQSTEYIVRVPLVEDIANLFDLRPISKYSWFKYDGKLFSRITDIEAISTTQNKSKTICDLLVQTDESYMTSCLLAHNGGVRKGAVAAYLEVWHRDIFDFIATKYVSIDENRRCPNIHTVSWIPDLFMKRLIEGNDQWTLFSPADVPDLHSSFGKDFEAKYIAYENNPATPKETTSLRKLWEEMLTSLLGKGFGHPWITFKDPSNVMNPQKHVGVVNNSNLCCITSDQRVVTDRGMLTVGELYKLGGQNKIIGLDGINDASQMLLPRPNAPIVQINTKQGYTHKVTPDHKVWVKDIGWVEAQDLKEGDKLLIQQQEGLFGSDHNPDLAYIMGLVAGDGTFSEHSVCIDLWEKEFDKISVIEQKVAQLLAQSSVDYNTTSTSTPTFSISEKHSRARLMSAPLGRILEEHNFNKNTKLSIPQLIWKGDKQTVSSYLQGIYQADATITSGGEVTTIAFASINLQLIRDIQIIWANFGVKTSINKMRDIESHPMPDGKGGNAMYTSQPLYRLLITSIKGCQIAESIIKLTESRNSESVNKFKANIQKEGYVQKMYASFTNLTDLPNEDAYCLTVDSDTHAWTVNGMITKNTEILLPTSQDETAVCNLASINIANFILPKPVSSGYDHPSINSITDSLDWTKLERTIRTAIRMLDNVIDINFYTTNEAKNANTRHRPVGLGLMGLQTLLQKLNLPFEGQESLELNDWLFEYINYIALDESSNLATEKGQYSTFQGSDWSKGIFPIDNFARSITERGIPTSTPLDNPRMMNWDILKQKVMNAGLRNSQVMAIAPTRTISYIAGVSPSVEPWDNNIFTEVGMTGKYTMINEELVDALENAGLWNDSVINQIRNANGSVQNIEIIPLEIRNNFKTAWEIHPKWLIGANARRQKWIDMGISFNQWINTTNGKDAERMYIECWKAGLKTTYYLHSRSGSQASKVGVETVQDKDVMKILPSGAVCDMTDPECEACQ